MNAYKFAQLPSNSSVAAFVTMAVSGWFLVAAAAILADPSSVYTQRGHSTPVYGQAVHNTVAVAPEARLTITVSARRLAANL